LSAVLKLCPSLFENGNLDRLRVTGMMKRAEVDGRGVEKLRKKGVWMVSPYKTAVSTFWDSDVQAANYWRRAQIVDSDLSKVKHKSYNTA
jgi:hypothetical protein